MKPSALIRDDDAVSPVIGVILMVAITVILAAVIASFVLGLGDSADKVQPNSSFSFDSEDDGSGSNALVTATLTDGDTVEFDEIVLRGSAVSEKELSTTGLSGDTWDVGQSIEIGDSGASGVSSPDVDIAVSQGEELRIVWEELDGDNAATLETHDVPSL